MKALILILLFCATAYAADCPMEPGRYELVVVIDTTSEVRSIRWAGTDSAITKFMDIIDTVRTWVDLDVVRIDSIVTDWKNVRVVGAER